MAENEGTINASESSALETGSGDLVSTIPDGTPSEGTIKAKDRQEPAAKGEEKKDVKPKEEGGDGKEGDGDKKAKAEKDEGDDARFDKHPRFKSLIETNKELKTQNKLLMDRLDGVLQRIESGNTTHKTETRDSNFLKNLLTMSDDDLADMIAGKPKDFISNLAQNLSESFESNFAKKMKELQQNQNRMTQDQMVNAKYAEFGKQNEDFWDMWDSGEITTYMKKHPAHNAMSAYYELTSENRAKSVQQRIDEAVKKAVKEKEEEINKNIKAKRSITYLPGSSGESKSSSDAAPELKDSKKFGGAVSVLTRRLLQRRQEA